MFNPTHYLKIRNAQGGKSTVYVVIISRSGDGQVTVQTRGGRTRTISADSVFPLL